MLTDQINYILCTYTQVLFTKLRTKQEDHKIQVTLTLTLSYVSKLLYMIGIFNPSLQIEKAEKTDRNHKVFLHLYVANYNLKCWHI